MKCNFNAHPFSFIEARERGTLRAFGVRAIDGDTIVAMVDVGFSTYMLMHLRIAGVNTPEIVGTTGEERERALNAQRFTESMTVGEALLVRTYLTRTGEPQMTFQRYVADVDIVLGKFAKSLRSLAAALLENNLAEKAKR